MHLRLILFIVYVFPIPKIYITEEYFQITVTVQVCESGNATRGHYHFYKLVHGTERLSATKNSNLCCKLVYYV